MPALQAPIKPPGAAARPRAELILQEIDALPTLPAVAARLIALTTSDDSSAREVVELVSRDPVLTATLLKFAGRADQGIRRDHLNVQQAVTLLGLKAVRNVVLSVQVSAALPQSEDNERAITIRREMWRHALATACVAEELAPRVLGPRDRGDAFVAGLLHDIGKIALDTGFPKSYARVVERVDQRRQNVCDAEQEVFGLDHTVAGKRLATRWQLPSAVVECIWLHHQDPRSLPNSVRHARLVGLVHVADRLVRRLHIGFSGYRGDDGLEPVAESLGISSEQLQDISRSLPQRLAPMSELLGLDDADARHLYADSLQKAVRELGALNTELHAANRHLALRSLFLDVLNSFNSALQPDGDASKVCQMAALALAVAGKTKAAMVLIADSSGENLYTGTADSASRHVGFVVSTVELQGALRDLRSGPNGLDADSPLLKLWRDQTGECAVPHYVAAIAIHDGRESVGAILLPSDDTLPQAGAAEWCALTDAIRLAAARAFALRDAERHQEELYDLSRRLQTTQRDLVRARTISMIAEMSAGAAHEINNPLSVISGRAQLLLSECPDAEQTRALTLIVEKAQEASRIVTDLMNFAKPAPPQPIHQPLRSLLDTLCQHWRSGFSLSPQQLILGPLDDGLTFYADAQQVSEMLESIVTNAVQACREDSPRVIINSPSAASDETVRIEVQDNGAGMSPEVAERAIDPFFSHRSAGRGRGLGLSRAYRLAGINGGQLWIDSTPDVGTTVTIELPSRLDPTI